MSDPDIELALEHWREINAEPRKWARLDMIQFNPELRIIRLYHGYIGMQTGKPDFWIGYRQYMLKPDGTVSIYHGSSL